MNHLQQAMEDSLRDSIYWAAADMIRDKLRDQGVNLGSRDFKRLIDHLRSDDAGLFQLRSWRWWESRQLTIGITDAEADVFKDGVTTFLEEDLPNLISSTSDALAISITDTLIHTWRKEQRRQAKNKRNFEGSIATVWGVPIDRLRMLLTVARELGDAANTHLHEQIDEIGDNLVDTLTRLHARACQVTEEIVCLLESGLSDGAMARWRTLHEISCVAMLLQQHGDSLAERYIEHDVVESWHAAREYQAICGSLGQEPYSELEMQELDAAFEELVRRYGPAFKGPYGWAAGALKEARPGFGHIERAVGVEALRAYYRLASHNVHSNPKGTFFRLGLLDESDVLLAGPSIFGLVEPGRSAAISLLQASSALVCVAPNLDLICGLKVLQRLETQIGDELLESHQAVI